MVVGTEYMTTDDSNWLITARCELMLDVTRRTLKEDPDLKLCEGLRLIEATHRAFVRLDPLSVGTLEADILPGLLRVLMERFGLAELPPGPVN